jgi:OOP family OmpA-OmpF porin
MLGSGSAAWAQQGPLLQNPGFQIHRAQLTPAGESSFMVDTPRFSAGTLSVGLSLDYGHRPLVLGVEGRDGQFRMTRVLIEHQMLGSLDVAGSFCDCMRLSASVPFTLLERGPSSADPSASTQSLSLLASSIRSAEADPRTGIVLENGLSASDPRLGMMVRLYGKPGEGLFSASLGVDVWVPLRKFLSRSSSHTSDMDARVLSKLVLTGNVYPLSWSVTGAFLFRPEAHLGDLPSPQGSTAGSELQAGAGLYYTTPRSGFSVGPEARFTTLVTPRDYAFKPFYSSLEVLLGLHLRAGERLRIGMAGGAGMDRQPGTPDFRLLLRMSYDALTRGPQARPPAPLPLPPEPPRVGMQLSVAPPVVELPKPERPEEVLARLDRDGDGILDARDVCPETPLGETPDPRRLGCPAEDRDRDTVLDAEDACPEEPGMPGLEPRVNGCPLEGVEVRQDRLLPRQPLAFAVNTDVLLAESLPVLAQLAEAIRARPWIQKLRIEGHTDNSGSNDFNQSLSLRRAESVRRWLVEQGLDAARLEVAGFGPDHPIADNATEAGRASNRRVDFVITSTSPERPADQNP